MLVNFENNLKEGIKMGFFRKSINPEFLSRIYINGLQGVRNIELFSLPKVLKYYTCWKATLIII